MTKIYIYLFNSHGSIFVFNNFKSSTHGIKGIKHVIFYNITYTEMAVILVCDSEYIMS